MENHQKFAPNESIPLTAYSNLKEHFGGRWIQEDTAILVVHGIGSQNPLETLDSFARGLLETFLEAGYSLELEHLLARKQASNSQLPWFDNYISIRKKNGEGARLEIYEYYWAHETEGQASLHDLNTWLNGVTKGARHFYEDNVKFALHNQDKSIFITNGKFRPLPYWFCVSFVPQLIASANWVIDGAMRLVTAIPVLGPLLSLVVRGKMDGTLDKVSNILNDVSIYNTTDVKSRFFKIRNCILDGAVNALRYLLEAHPVAGENHSFFKYQNVLLVGHSLGSQIAFDAVNRINHLVNQGEIKGYNCQGKCDAADGEKAISERLNGLVTFGSPLDKIAFFFREQVPATEYLRCQLINNFHGFKQRDWVNLSPFKTLVRASEKRLFEHVPWRNYWDAKDYVSGSLDFYKGVVNINCAFPASRFSFTHSNYWSCTNMYGEIIEHFLLSGERGIETETINGKDIVEI